MGSPNLPGKIVVLLTRLHLPSPYAQRYFRTRHRTLHMTGPARAGLFIYAKNLGRLAAFYEKLLGLARVRATDELVVLSSPDLQLIVHAMPAQVAAQTEIASPPVFRDNAALKFFYTVPSLSEAQTVADSLGGQVLSEHWQGPGFVVRNAVDPEGNIFQLRAPTP